MGVESFEWRGLGRKDTGVEGLPRLRALLDKLVVPGAGISELEEILLQEPQRDFKGQLRYLLTSGLAVELLTGFVREHHDVDLVIMNPRELNQWEIYGTDNVTPGQYWASMKFDPHYLAETAEVAQTRVHAGMPIEVVHPAILMVQKSSDAFGRPPRQKDLDDVKAIVRYWRVNKKFTKDWDPVVSKSLDALPVDQAKVSFARLSTVVKGK